MSTSLGRNYLISQNSANLNQDILYGGNYLVSNQNSYNLLLQTDLNLVGYIWNIAFWASGTNSSPDPGCFLLMQQDCNLVLYSSLNVPLWATNTSNWSTHGPFRVVMQNDRNIVLYDALNTVIWASNTGL